MYTLHCTEIELATNLADLQLAAITELSADTAVPLMSWPLARGAEHNSVRLARGKVLRESLDIALTWRDGSVQELPVQAGSFCVFCAGVDDDCSCE
jgi:hypothetical protein